MRFRLKTALSAAMMICALSGVAVASASAHEFHASKEGALKGNLSGGEQVFSSSTGAYYQCEQAAIAGKVKAGYFTKFNPTISYTKCYGNGYKTTVTPMEFELNANGTVKLLNTVTFETKVLECKTTFVPSKNENLSEMVYVSNHEGTLTLRSRYFMKGTSYSLTGEKSTQCGGYGEEHSFTTGEFLLVSLEGGTLSWA
jgi:hypothetical protein